MSKRNNRQDKIFSVGIRLLSALVILSGLQACEDRKMRELKGFVASAFKDQRPEIEPLPEIPPYKGFEYVAIDKDDPFSVENIIANQSGKAAVGNSPDPNRHREPLEQYPLDALKMVGTIVKAEQTWVIVQTSEGIAHRATIGNYMGQNQGKVKQIIPEEQKIMLAELVVDHAGRWVTREVEITIDE